MHLHLAYDHNGYHYRDELNKALTEAGYVVIDHGNNALTPTDDYPDFAFPAAELVARETDSKGIFLCGSGAGVCIAANKVRGIRAAQVDTESQAISAAKDDQANIICLGTDVVSITQATHLILTFLQTSFEGGRHERRVKKIEDFERKHMKEAPKAQPSITDVQVSLSILSLDFMNLEKELERLTPHIDRIHFDIMDGHFVPNLSFGLPLLQLMPHQKPIDCHIMTSNPHEFIKEYEKHCEAIYVHYKVTTSKTPQILQLIREQGCYAGITINPDVPVSAITPFIEHLTHVLVMSVEPGFGGQACQVEVLDKIEELKALKPELIITVDGGMNATTAAIARKKGADIIVSGSYLSKASDITRAVSTLKGL